MNGDTQASSSTVCVTNGWVVGTAFRIVVHCIVLCILCVTNGCVW